MAQVRKTKPNLDVVRPLITDGTDAAVPQAWLRAERLTAPEPEDIALKCAALRSAADSERQEMERSDALAADRAQLLEMGLDFHEHFGDQKCPVCGHGTLDANVGGRRARGAGTGSGGGTGADGRPRRDRPSPLRGDGGRPRGRRPRRPRTPS